VSNTPNQQVLRRPIRPCRACGRVRHVDDDGHCDECNAAERVLLS